MPRPPGVKPDFDIAGQRTELGLTQSQLVELTRSRDAQHNAGVKLRTLQRAERGHAVSRSSLELIRGALAQLRAEQGVGAQNRERSPEPEVATGLKLKLAAAYHGPGYGTAPAALAVQLLNFGPENYISLSIKLPLENGNFGFFVSDVFRRMLTARNLPAGSRHDIYLDGREILGLNAESGGIKGVVVTDVLDRVVAESARHELVTALENLRRLLR